MEPLGLSQCPLEPANGPYGDPVEPSTRPHIVFFFRSSLILTSVENRSVITKIKMSAGGLTNTMYFSRIHLAYFVHINCNNLIATTGINRYQIQLYHFR